MEEVLKKKEIHVFSMFDQNLAFDVNDMHLFGINRLTKEILEKAEGKTPGQIITELSGKFPADRISNVLEKLMKANLVGSHVPELEEMPTDTETGEIENKEKRNDAIKKMNIYVTQRCNLKCRYCLTRRGGNIKNKKMSERVAQAAIDLFIKESNNSPYLSIGFYGGEPLLEFSLIKKIIHYSKRKGGISNKKINYNITTNGTLLTDEVVDFLVENNVQITLSIDGDPKTHDANRVFLDGSGSFAKILPGFIKLKEKTNLTHSIVVVNNLEINLKKVTQALLDLGVSTFGITPALSPDGQLDIGNSNIGEYTREYGEMVKYLLDNELVFQDPPPMDFSTTFSLLDKKVKKNTDCNAAYGRISVDPDGNILPCDNFIGKPDFYMGNVLTGIEKNHQKTFKKIRAVNNQTCRNCWARHLCGGWCPYFSYSRYGDLGKPVDTLCKIKKHCFETGMAIYSFFKKKQKKSPEPTKKEVPHEN